MNVASFKTLVLAVLLSLTANLSLAQLSDPQLTISLLSEDFQYEGNGKAVSFSGLQLTQGLLKIQADEGRASELNFKDSEWQLTGNVVINIEGGTISCDSARLQFKANELRIADIRGEPATFEVERDGTDDVTYAEARQLRYQLETNAIEFTGDVQLVEGGNQITSSFIVYNILTQRLQAGTSAEDGKVQMTFTPSDPDTESEETDDSGTDGDAP